MSAFVAPPFGPAEGYGTEGPMRSLIHSGTTTSADSLEFGDIAEKANQYAIKGRYLCLRAFIKAESDDATIDVYGWMGPKRKGFRLARLTFTGGAEAVTGDPFNAGETFPTGVECDHVKFLAGIARPVAIVRGIHETTPANGAQMLVYLPTCGAMYVTAKLLSITASSDFYCGFGATNGYPMPKIGGATTATASGGNLTAGVAATMTFAGEMQEIVVAVRTGYSGVISVKYGATGAAATSWPQLSSGQSVVFTKPAYFLSLNGTVNATKGTDFEVYGWE